MKRILSKCPNCESELKITALSCEGCGLELRNNFEQSIFDKLSKESYEFLIIFLKNQGNLKAVQEEYNCSYLLAKRKLTTLLEELKFENNEKTITENFEWEVDEMSVRASEIIKRKFMEYGGSANIETARGKIFKVDANNETIGSETALRSVRYEYIVFDYITELLIEKGGEARKGIGRLKLGEKGSTTDTVVGRIGEKYYNKKEGEYFFDPVFILVAIMEWAGIVNNCRGYIEFTEEYKRKIGW